MKTINVSLVKTVNDSYPIHIQPGLLEDLPDIIDPLAKNNKILIVTDTNVRPLYGDTLLHSLTQKGYDSHIFSFPAGEEQKNIHTKIDIETHMFQNRFGRDSLILALGGGVVGDLAGFTASTFNRGIPYIQIPTSIVAQVDSSIGGKTAIDVPQGKNLIGTFYQPKMVLIDPLVLKTLPDVEYNSGLAEVVKHGVINDREHFTFLQSNVHHIIKRDIEVLTDMIEANCHIKRKVVEEDEREGNLRKILNFGHTIGHAVEQLKNYTMLHGDCVALGMVVESDISIALGRLSPEAKEDIVHLLSQFSLPTEIPGDLSPQAVYDATLLDKKTLKNQPNYSLPEAIGSMLYLNDNYGIPVEKAHVLEAISKNLAT